MRRNSQHHPESIEKMRRAHIGQRLGKKDTTATRHKKALATLHHWATPSIRRRMTEAIRAGWARRRGVAGRGHEMAS